MPVELKQPPLTAAVETLHLIMAQDLEPTPIGGGTQIREGVAKDRQISFEDEEMRHGRKSSAKRFDGYKRHIARDIDEQLILAAETLPANTPDTAGVDPLLVAVELQHREVTSLHIDRGYLGDKLINTYDEAGVVIVCKPWPVRNPAGHFSKPDFPRLTWRPYRPPVQPAKSFPSPPVRPPVFRRTAVGRVRYGASVPRGKAVAGRPPFIPRKTCCNGSASSPRRLKDGPRCGSASRLSMG